jgi:glycosyltransferase involved in cell wall biosynthesis
MSIQVTIPVQKQTRLLEECLASVRKYTRLPHEIKVLERPDLNVAEARQVALNESDHDYVVFLDDDSVITDPNWLEAMVGAVRDDTVCTFGRELWGSDECPLGLPHEYAPKGEDTPTLEFGPAACMLVVRDRVPKDVKWDPYIGLNNGWLGGDLEEVDFCFKLREAGLKLREADTVFHHTGGKTRFWDHRKTDRYKTMITMMRLLRYKYTTSPQDGDWFKGFQYVKASATDDNMLAEGSNLRDCYKDVIARNGLSNKKFFIKHGLV